MIDLTNLTTPQARIIERLKNSGNPLAIADIKVASGSYTATVLRELLEMRMIHIAAWRRAAGNNNGMTALFAWGEGLPAPKPATKADTLKRRKRERDAARMARIRAAEKAEKAKPKIEPPTRPAKVPGIGFWGI